MRCSCCGRCAQRGGAGAQGAVPLLRGHLLFSLTQMTPLLSGFPRILHAPIVLASRSCPRLSCPKSTHEGTCPVLWAGLQGRVLVPALKERRADGPATTQGSFSQRARGCLRTLSTGKVLCGAHDSETQKKETKQRMNREVTQKGGEPGEADCAGRVPVSA